MVLPIVKLGLSQGARTTCKRRAFKDHRAPSHISKTVPPTVHSGPPNWIKSRTLTIRFPVTV